ncbi:MAG: Crp/Fnr family transcriptional regulator [Arcobacter sp.]|nr:MAG: Crp/Fnr family transcriptional regulator [Arcobacter sp.]
MQSFSFFSKLSDEAQTELLYHAHSISIPAGMTLFHQGDTCQDILFLTKGSVRVYRQHVSGAEITLYFLEPGEQCNVNITSSLSEMPAIGTAVSESDIEGYMLSSELVKKYFMNEPKYQQFVFGLYDLRLTALAEMIEDVRFKKLDERLLDWINSQKDSKVKITHEQVASHLGSAREVISRLLKEFENQGIVKLSRGSIEILNTTKH